MEWAVKQKRICDYLSQKRKLVGRHIGYTHYLELGFARIPSSLDRGVYIVTLEK
jgi:hypothetical protein